MIKAFQTGEIIQTDEIKPKCCTCDYSVGVENSLEWRICQKGAPYAAWDDTLGTWKGGWPLVKNNDYCGDHPHYPRTKAVATLEMQLVLLREIKDLLGK